MLESLHLTNVGPAPELALDLAPRLNLITGDNGVGKSFLLDVAWWALTRKWPHDLNAALTTGYPARPTDTGKPATIEFRLTGKAKSIAYQSHYVPRAEAWQGRAGRPWNPGLVIYAHADGGFSVWDPARNYWKTEGKTDVQERLPGYVFSPKDVWDGLTIDVNGRPTPACNGLLRDWASWIKERGDNARLMEEILGRLAPEGEPLKTGPLVRLSVADVRDIPTIATPYSSAVPILHASSGVRRIVGLAYMLLWSWNEHGLAADLLGEPRTRQVVMLFDEVENHLSPRWQRTILRSLLRVADGLHAEARVQLLAVTHSPLLLASAEPWFDPKTDAWFDMDLVPAESRVALEKRAFVRRGTAGKWLTSKAFDLRSEGRSLEAEKAIEDAERLLERNRDGHTPTEAELDRVDGALRAVLPDVDRFWVRWSSFVDDLRGSA